MIFRLNPGGEAADTLVKMYLNGTETMIRLSGSFLKNLLALTLALAKENKKVSGKIALGKMLKETRDLRTFSMTETQYKAFKKQAKKQGILFAAVRDKDGKDKLVDVILPATETDRANLLFSRILYDPNLGSQSPEPPRTEKKHWWQKIFHRQKKKERNPAPEQNPVPENPNPPLKGEEKERMPENPTKPEPEIRTEYQEIFQLEVFPEPEVLSFPAEVIPPALPAPQGLERSPEGKTVEILPEQWTHNEPPLRENAAAQPETVQKDAFPLQPGLPGTRDRSPSPGRSGDMKTTPEKPSVLKRLAGFRAQLDQKNASAPEKGKDTAKGKSPVKGSDSAAKKPSVPKKLSAGKVPKTPVR